MEETIRIQSLRWHPQATEQQLEQWKAELFEKDCGTLLVLPDPADPSQYLGILLEKYYTAYRECVLGEGLCTFDDIKQGARQLLGSHADSGESGMMLQLAAMQTAGNPV